MTADIPILGGQGRVFFYVCHMPLCLRRRGHRERNFMRTKIWSKDGVDEWTHWKQSIVEMYPNLRTTIIVNNRKVCVDNNQETRAHQS